MKHPWRHHPGVRTGKDLTLGERAADRMRNVMGSWPFVFGFILIMVIWAGTNSYFLKNVLDHKPFDPYPYILLNLFLSMLAGLQGAILLIAAKRADAIAAEQAMHHLQISEKTDKNTEDIQKLLATNTQLTQDVHTLVMDIHQGLHVGGVLIGKGVPAHSANQSHHYMMHYPEHPAREDDPHYKDFHHYHEKTRPTARCYIGERIGFEDCRDDKGNLCPPPESGGEQPGLELHHAHIEFSLQNGVNLTALEVDYPGISNADEVGAWVESAPNFRWLCSFHHRGAAGAHSATHSDWEASQYIEGLITAY